ncbi:hypothetical protein A9Q74_14020 [Colwellia sp. 39_35_sub15_T18]|nr:hypothetical protein A9Q74_14020 [Colwellia sp. 39_35_sub15_T18]
MRKNKAIFLDRDGVINEEINYLHKIEDFVFTRNCLEALKAFQTQGYLLFIITNQAGIGRGYYTETDYHLLTNWMLARLKQHNIEITQVRFCPHHAQEGIGKYKRDCSYRKPNSGMINELVEKYNIDVEQSILVGDTLSDIQAGVNAKVNTLVLVKSGKKLPDKLPDTIHYLCEDLAEYSQLMLTELALKK